MNNIMCFTCEYHEIGLGRFFSISFFDFNIMENNESSGFEASSNVDFLAPQISKFSSDLPKLGVTLPVEVSSTKNL